MPSRTKQRPRDLRKWPRGLDIRLSDYQTMSSGMSTRKRNPEMPRQTRVGKVEDEHRCSSDEGMKTRDIGRPAQVLQGKPDL